MPLMPLIPFSFLMIRNVTGAQGFWLGSFFFRLRLDEVFTADHVEELSA